MQVRLISGISHRFPWLSQSEGQVAHVLLTRSPLIRPASWSSPFDLHVLSTPPAFVLSQNQTLRKCQLAPHHPKAARQPTKRNGLTGSTRQTNQIRLFMASPPTEVKERHRSQPRPTTINTPNHRPETSQIASHMASTIWHTVEFSRNRRASIQVLQPVRRQPF